MALALQNALCLLSKLLVAWPTKRVMPGGTARKNLRVRPDVLPHPENALWSPAVVEERGLRIQARSVVAGELTPPVGGRLVEFPGHGLQTQAPPVVQCITGTFALQVHCETPVAPRLLVELTGHGSQTQVPPALAVAHFMAKFALQVHCEAPIVPRLLVEFPGQLLHCVLSKSFVLHDP